MSFFKITTALLALALATPSYADSQFNAFALGTITGAIINHHLNDGSVYYQPVPQYQYQYQAPQFSYQPYQYNRPPVVQYYDQTRIITSPPRFEYYNNHTDYYQQPYRHRHHHRPGYYQQYPNGVQIIIR